MKTALLLLLAWNTCLGQLPENRAQRAKEFFEKLSVSNIHLCDEFYDSQVQFKDPSVEHKGLQSLKVYYLKLYSAS